MMKIERVGAITAFTILDAPQLDPITVILQDDGPGRGRIIIECWGKAWSAYWGAMGTRTLKEFVLSCDRAYIETKLSPERLKKADAAYLKRIVAAVLEALPNVTVELELRPRQAITIKPCIDQFEELRARILATLQLLEGRS